jgi:hypothetical protein
MKNKRTIFVGILFLVLTSCCDNQSEPLITVKAIETHSSRDSEFQKLPWYQKPIGSWAIYERTDTGERFSSCQVLGKQGDTFKAKVSDLQRSCF